MYNGIGLTTPRGSGTNGHIQSNKFFVRPKNNPTAKDGGSYGAASGLAKKPNKEILEHDRKRQIELKLVVLEDKLADQGYTDSEIAEKIAEARKNLELAAVAEASREDGEFNPLSVSDNKVSDTQTHQVAARKEKQLEALRAAFDLDSDGKMKKNERGSNSEERGYKDEISDGSDKDQRDGAKLHEKAPKNKNSDATKVIKVEKKQSARDANESKSHKNKELGELTDSSDTDIDDMLSKRIPRKHQKYHEGSASDSDSEKKSKKSSRRNRKGRKHADDYSDSGSDSDVEKYVKGTRKAHDSRSREHDIDELKSDDEKYEKISERHDKRSRKPATDFSESEEKKYKKLVKSRENDSKDEKYQERYDNKSRRHARDDSVSDHENYGKTSKRSDEKSRKHDSDDFGYDVEKYEKTSKRGDKEGQQREFADSKYNDLKYGKDPKVAEVSPTDRWNSNHDKYKRYEGGNEFDIEETKKLTKSKGNSRRNRHDTDDDDHCDDVTRNIKKSRKSSKPESDSSDDNGSSYDRENYTRGKRVMEKSRQDLEGGRSGQVRNEGKSFISSAMVEKSKGKSVAKDVDDNEDASRKLEDLSRSKRDTTEDKNLVIMQGKRKYEDGSHDELPVAKSRSRTTRSELNDMENKSVRNNKDVSDQKREDYLREKKYDGIDSSKEINKKEKVERDHRERRRSDLDRKEEEEGRRYSRNDDISGAVRHRKDEEDSLRKNDRNGNRTRGREEEEERTSGRDKNRHVGSSKRAKYDDYRSGEKRGYDDDRRSDRGDVRTRQHD